MYVEVPSRDADNDVDSSFMDGCAVLWVVPWPTSGTVQDYLDRFRNCIHGRLKKTDVYLASLLPTNEAFNENVARAHLQVTVWRNALQPDPPAIDPTAFGWSLEEASKTLIPTTLPSDTPLAPDDLLKLVRCSCSSEAT